MRLGYLLDEDISHRVATGLRQRGIDAVSVHEIGRANLEIPDEDQLAFATQQGRVLVTFNRRDYETLSGRWSADGQTHAGILWCSEQTVTRRDIGGLVRALEAAAGRYESLAGICIHLSPAEPT